MPTTPDRDLAAATIRAVALRLCPFVGAMFFVNWLDRVAISFAGPSGMNRDLGLGPAQFGLAASIFFVGYLAFEVPSNLALHRFGARRWLARIMVTWGVVTALTAAATGPWSLYGLRLLLGVAEAGFFPGAIFFISYWVPRRHRAGILGTFYLSQPLTIVFGAPLASLLIEAGGVTGLAGWRTMYLGVGVLAVAIGVLAWRFLPDRPAEARWLTPAQRAWLTDALRDDAADPDPADAAAPHAAAPHDTVASALRSGRVWLFCAIYFGIIYGLYALSFFLPTIIAGFEHGTGAHLGVMARGLVTAIPYVPAAIFLYAWSRDASRRGTRPWHVAIPTLVGGVTVPLALLFGSPVATVVVMTVLACAVFGALPPFWSLPSRFLRGPAAAAGIALINTVGNVAGLIAPYLTGWLRVLTGGYEVAMCVVGGCMTLSAVIVFALLRHPAEAGRAGAPPLHPAGV